MRSWRARETQVSSHQGMKVVSKERENEHGIESVSRATPPPTPVPLVLGGSETAGQSDLTG